MKPLTMNQEYQARISEAVKLAKENPRDIQSAFKQINDEIFFDKEFTKQCIYTVPDPEKGFYTGLSVRAAEVVARNFKNMSVLTQVEEYDNDFIIVHGIAHDFQLNNLYQIEIRKPYSFKGKRLSEQQMNAAISATCSVAFREAVFKIVPRLLVEKLKEKVFETLESSWDGDITFFTSNGISEKRLEKLNPLQLIGIRHSIETKSSEFSDFFPKTVEDDAVDVLKQKLGLDEGDRTIPENMEGKAS